MRTWQVNTVCDMWASRCCLRDILRESELGLCDFFLVLRRMRRAGDLRMFRRRGWFMRDKIEWVLDMLRCQPVSEEDIAEVFWGDQWPGHWRQDVTRVVSRLKRAGHRIRYVSGGYVLDE